MQFQFFFSKTTSIYTSSKLKSVCLVKAQHSMLEKSFIYDLTIKIEKWKKFFSFVTVTEK